MIRNQIVFDRVKINIKMLTQVERNTFETCTSFAMASTTNEGGGED
jgi:hypothetical protein